MQLQHSSRQNALSKPIEDNRIADIIKLIVEVEQVKQITLSNDQRSALGRELYRINLPMDRIKIQADIVKRSETYGKIALEFWMKDIPVFTYFEIKQFVDKEIERRRNIAVDAGIDHAQILSQGLAEVFQELQSQYYDALDKKKEELRQEIKHIGQMIRFLPETKQKQLLKTANKKQKKMKQETPIYPSLIFHHGNYSLHSC